jgi:hypothetical protein
MKNISFTKNSAPANTMFSSETASERNSESLPLFFSTERDSVHFSPNSESLLLFLFHGTVRKFYGWIQNDR